MSRKIIMKQRTYELLKIKLVNLINHNTFWPKLDDTKKNKMLNEIYAELGRRFNIEEMDYIWEDINMNPYRYKYICIIDKDKTHNKSDDGR